MTLIVDAQSGEDPYAAEAEAFLSRLRDEGRKPVKHGEPAVQNRCSALWSLSKSESDRTDLPERGMLRCALSAGHEGGHWAKLDAYESQVWGEGGPREYILIEEIPGVEALSPLINP